MANEQSNSLERFRVRGNVLKLTPRFDPRYQSRAGMELMNIVSSLAGEIESSELVLDISEAEALPSMMIGILYGAKDLTDKAGKKLRIKLKTETYNRLQSLGLGKVFLPLVGGGASEDIEILSEAVGAVPDKENQDNGA